MADDVLQDAVRPNKPSLNTVEKKVYEFPACMLPVLVAQDRKVLSNVFKAKTELKILQDWGYQWPEWG